MSLIVDASVAAKLFATEPDSKEARARLAGEQHLLAPESVLVEVWNALWKKRKRGEISSEQLLLALPRISTLFARLVPTRELFDEAARLSEWLPHPIHDCLYLVLARREDALLVTADIRMMEAAKRAGVAVDRL